MRRLAWGLLATFGLTMLVGCGTDGGTPTSAPAPAPDVRAVTDTALASAARDAPAQDIDARPAQFTILLTSPEGVSSPGLDAIVSALLARPDLGLVVVAPGADATGTAVQRSATPPAPVPAETMSGQPAAAVNGTMADTVDAALGMVPTEPNGVDLVVIGASSDPQAVEIARAVRAAGLPALVVTVGPDPDLAAAGLLLLDVLDYGLDDLAGATQAHVLDVAACLGETDGPTMVTADADPAAACELQAIP